MTGKNGDEADMRRRRARGTIRICLLDRRRDQVTIYLLLATAL
jgi:hypothetical protein